MAQISCSKTWIVSCVLVWLGLASLLSLLPLMDVGSEDPTRISKVVRERRSSSVPNWILDCEGLECLYKILRVLTYRFPIRTVHLWDHIFETYNERDALKKELQVQKLNHMRSEHASAMATVFREIEWLEAQSEAEMRRHEMRLLQMRTQDQERRPKVLKLF